MHYTKEERLDIGRRIYNDEISCNQAVEIYGISVDSARNYMRLYRNANQLPIKKTRRRALPAPSFLNRETGLEDLQSMSKEELIQELVKARITEARLKKGYEVKGDGTVILYDNGNTK